MIITHSFQHYIFIYKKFSNIYLITIQSNILNQNKINMYVNEFVEIIIKVKYIFMMISNF